ncbi:Zn-ribbon domain-containing OB-fold protein [Aquabacterium sp. J223]|uniref:Zn-ribbon domain-containing OB-fold protein n=1 Tax=Aquabacterium sp. J223 TaxID=2898431 RepID=UPI003917575E
MFELPKCTACERHHFYPRLVCPHCGADTLQWQPASGHGVVYSTTVVRRPNGGDYNVALVDLAEGPRLMTRVEDIAPEAVVIGLPVRARVVQQDGAPLLVFVPESAS